MNNMQQLPINEEVMSKLMLEIQSLKRALTIEKATTNALRKELEETEKKTPLFFVLFPGVDPTP